MHPKLSFSLPIAMVGFLTAWVRWEPAAADMVYLKHGDKMEGRILHVEETAEGIEYIRIQSGTAIITIPGTSIDLYVDDPEMTDTPTPTATGTPTATELPEPTSTPSPRPTPTRPPAPRPRPMATATPTATPGEEAYWDEEADYEQIETGPGGEISDLLRQLGMSTEVNLTLIAMGFVLLICYTIAYLMCVINAFGKGAGEGILTMLVGGVCCCICIGPVYLLYYTSKKYDGNYKTLIQLLLLVFFVLNIAYNIYSRFGAG